MCSPLYQITVAYFKVFLFILIDWIVLMESIHPNVCPRMCKCYPRKLYAWCSNYDNQLSYVPKLPTYVNKLQLASNHMSLISNDTFVRLSSRNLTWLSMESCGLRLLEENSFENLMHLETLDLGSNRKLNISSLKSAIKSLQKTELVRLSFDFMNWTSKHLSTSIFEFLADNKVDEMTLRENKIDSWSDTASLGLNNLSKLSLSNNKISTCQHFSSLLSLEHLDLGNNMLIKCNIEMVPKTLVSLRLSHNGLRKVPNFCSNDGTSALLPRLEKLQIGFNNIITIRNMINPCLPSLKYLLLNGNNIKRFPARIFSYMSRLLVLKLERMQEGVRKIDRDAFDIPSLKRLSFIRNNFCFDTKTATQSISFGTCRNLEILDLSYNIMPTSNNDLRQLLHGLYKLKRLHLVKVGWLTIPDVLFKLFPNVEKVWLSGNAISKLQGSLFSHNINLRYLYLDNNIFSYLGPNAFHESFWKFMKKIDLSGNPYVCNCDLVWFRNKLKSSSSLFHEYPKKYKCFSPSEIRGLEISKFNVTDDDCRKESVLLIALSSSGSICIFAGMLSFCIYIARWQIRHWIYLLRYRRGESSGISRADDYKYDAFISYAEEDGDFVHNILLHKLEVENEYKLCIHARDFEAGKIIVDNIVESMCSSRQVLLVMSQNFCKSKWCKFEQLIALDRWLNNESEPIVIIMLEDINSKNVNRDMKALLKTTTYAQWTSNGIGQDVFWGQLLSSLKR